MLHGADVPVLSDIEFSLAAGEVLGLVGASGCGKSTLLRILAGLDPDYDGQVQLDGRALHGPSRDIGVVFQEPRLFPWLTVAENIGFDLGQGHDAAWVAHLIDEVGLCGLGEALPKQLSGGQAQRVAIARALYTRPRVLLLDEPFSALDAFTRMRLQDLVLSLARAHGSSLVIVTHDVEEAILLSDRVLVLGAAPGRVVRRLEIPLQHPRSRGSAAVADLRGELLRTLERLQA
ncbi:ABC transporter ATP-binding protein [Roseateles amylovorans]|uniref:ABC transporter ATP-binding protein n=1 Tax=Roseateles amylovorans TaxID=2978473 RepID=A0ABY6B7I8_9BURK|nr:ABC transporter ATP-binding protein [Roseateles amylovorans]UXH80916.1 ABC transporter ATP-binding protein [Roseateles amylovorans]